MKDIENEAIIIKLGMPYTSFEGVADKNLKNFIQAIFHASKQPHHQRKYVFAI